MLMTIRRRTTTLPDAESSGHSPGSQMGRCLLLPLIAALALVATTEASASQLIDRNATGVRLAANSKGEALLTYRARGAWQHVRVWGAVNARQPRAGIPQVHLAKDYSGRYWQSFRNQCRPYDGPPLAFVVTACRAPDGSYWAVQSWQRTVPNFGARARLPVQRASELHVSHWTGPLAKLEVWTDWVYAGRYHHLFGRLTYNGGPVYGFSSTRQGVPRDGYGRNIYLDTFNSRYGKGWHRENGFLAHRPTGAFCYGFYPFTSRGSGNGSQYRLTVIGPGVTPDVGVTVAGLHDYDRSNAADVAYERQQNTLQASIAGADKQCSLR
jgi:hypothetical protein